MLNNRGTARQYLIKLFKEKGITSRLDKQRLIQEAIGRKSAMSALKLEEILTVITYISERPKEDLLLPLIAWVYVLNRDSALYKKQIQTLLSTIPDDVDIRALSFDFTPQADKPLTVTGFLSQSYWSSHINEIPVLLEKEWNPDNDSKETTLSFENQRQIKVYGAADVFSASSRV